MSDPVEQLRQGIHSYFREFGYNSCEMLFNELVRHGGMKPLLEDIGLNDPGNSDDQYVYLLNYLRRNGMEVFAKKMGAEIYWNTDRPATPPPSEPRAASGLPYMKQATPVNAPQYQRVKASLPESASSDRVRKPDSSKSAKSSPPKIKKSETQRLSDEELKSLRKAAEAGPPAPGEKPPEGYGTLPDGTWDGKTERRSSKERRANRDRRNEVDVIFKNRRYGGDRRSGNERRKDWPPKK